MSDALALIELDGVAVGLRALDALVKRAPVEVLEANLVEPGRYLILLMGGVAEVDESLSAVVDTYAQQVVAKLMLPRVHPALVAGLRGGEDRSAPDTLGVVEGQDIAGTLEACDRALKEASVSLCGVRVAVALGGRAYFVVHGTQPDVEAALASAEAVLQRRERLHRVELIPRPHREMVAWLLRTAPFQVG